MSLVLKFIRVFRFILFPFVYLVLPILSKKIDQRKSFELKNLSDPLAVDHSGELIATCFHVSSEGEFEQVIPIAKSLLAQDKKIEIIYTSPSVERSISEFASQYNSSEQMVFALRLPLVTSTGGRDSISKWVESSNLIMVRYDFFPELLELARVKKSFLVHATLKNKEESFWLKSIYSCFNWILPATQTDFIKFSRLVGESKCLESFDFRLIRISERLANAKTKLAQIEASSVIKKICEENFETKKLIFGNFWPNEIECFSAKMIEDILSFNLFVVVAPHSLGDQNIINIHDSLRNKLGGDIPIYVLDRHFKNDNFLEKFKNAPGIILFTQGGYLLELYSLFDFAFIGGGHGRSVHSLLEPFLAGCQLFCGPRTHRSTEYDLVREYQKERVSVLNDMSSLYDEINELNKTSISAVSFNDKFEIVLKSINEKMSLS